MAYNAIGNITSKTVSGKTFTYSYSASHKHAVSGVTYNGTTYSYTYDSNGNMTYGADFTNLGSIQARTITYNADNMPTQISHSSNITTQLTYGGTGERVKKRVYNGSNVTDNYYIGDHFEVKGGVVTKYIFAGNLRIAQVKGTTRSFFHKDHLGSSTVMTSATGTELESTEYLPFGSQRSHSGTNTSDYRYTDQELDSENGLYNYNARLYDPFIGRFITPDTIVPSPYNPQSLNRYSYCLNNPLIYTDPSGHISIQYDITDLTYDEWQAILEFEKYILINELHGRKLDPSLYLTGFKMAFPDPDTVILTSLLTKVRSYHVVHYTLEEGVSLSDDVLKKLDQIADKYYEATKKNIYITGGTRSAESQANAMYDKLKSGDDILKLYKNTTAAKEVKTVYDTAIKENKTHSATITDMTKVIQGQIDKGTYISKHLQNNALDVRSRTMNTAEKKAFRTAATGIANTILLETKPPHWHLSF
jgi:RHS repeat-associated protein